MTVCRTCARTPVIDRNWESISAINAQHIKRSNFMIAPSFRLSVDSEIFNMIVSANVGVAAGQIACHASAVEFCGGIYAISWRLRELAEATRTSNARGPQYLVVNELAFCGGTTICGR